MSDVILGSRCRAMKGTGLNIFFFFVKRSEDGGRNNDFGHQRDTLLVAADIMALLQLSSVSSPLSIALTPLQLTVIEGRLFLKKISGQRFLSELRYFRLFSRDSFFGQPQKSHKVCNRHLKDRPKFARIELTHRFFYGNHGNVVSTCSLYYF